MYVDVRVTVDVGADLVWQGDAALAGQRGGAVDVGVAAVGAVGDVLEAAADGASVRGVVGLRQQAADAAAAGLRRHGPAHLDERQARHQRAVHRGARHRRAHRGRRSHHGRRQEHGQRQRRALRSSHVSHVRFGSSAAASLSGVVCVCGSRILVWGYEGFPWGVYIVEGMLLIRVGGWVGAFRGGVKMVRW